MAARTYFPTDLLGQSTVCDVLGISQRTLARRFEHHTATNDASEIPPFVKVGKQRRWRYDYLLLFRDNATTLRGYLEGGYPPRGDEIEPQSTSDTLPPLGVVLGLISGWKEQERWRRASDILTRKAFRTSGEMRFEDLCYLYDPQWNDPTDQEVEAFTSRIELEIKTVVLEIGLPWIESFADRDEQYHTMLAAKNAIGAALRNLFKDEKRWRERAEVGDYEADMPMMPPAA